MVTDIVRYTLGSVVAFMLLPLIVTFWFTKTHIYTYYADVDIEM